MNIAGIISRRSSTPPPVPESDAPISETASTSTSDEPEEDEDAPLVDQPPEPDEDEEEWQDRYQSGMRAYCKYCYKTHQDWTMGEPGVWECERCQRRTSDECMEIPGVPPSETQEAFRRKYADYFNPVSESEPESSPTLIYAATGLAVSKPAGTFFQVTPSGRQEQVASPTPQPDHLHTLALPHHQSSKQAKHEV